jgi:thymidylate synthase
MRFYQNFGEAVNEIRRDLAEMGIEVHPQTMQDKYVADDDDYSTKELQDYIYKVFNPLQSLDQLSVTQPWADAEFQERINIIDGPINPGEAYKLRDRVWNEFLHGGHFAYTYNERMYFQLEKIINELKLHPDSRQLYLSIWNPEIDTWNLGSGSRVPCSLGYLFQLRNGKLHMKYFMRSCDFVTHFHNDVYLAVRLMEYVAKSAGVEPGDFTHYIGSFHVYRKDIQGVF